MERGLKGFADYLRQRLLLPEYGVDPYVRWVRYFLDFARPIKELGFEPCLDRFLAELNRTPDRPSWHAGQAKDALRIYYSQYRRGGSESPPAGSSEAPDIPDLLSQLSAAIRRKRYDSGSRGHTSSYEPTCQTFDVVFLRNLAFSGRIPPVPHRTVFPIPLRFSRCSGALSSPFPGLSRGSCPRHGWRCFFS